MNVKELREQLVGLDDTLTVYIPHNGDEEDCVEVTTLVVADIASVNDGGDSEDSPATESGVILYS